MLINLGRGNLRWEKRSIHHFGTCVAGCLTKAVEVYTVSYHTLETRLASPTEYIAMDSEVSPRRIVYVEQNMRWLCSAIRSSGLATVAQTPPFVLPKRLAAHSTEN